MNWSTTISVSVWSWRDYSCFASIEPIGVTYLDHIVNSHTCAMTLLCSRTLQAQIAWQVPICNIHTLYIWFQLYFGRHRRARCSPDSGPQPPGTPDFPRISCLCSHVLDPPDKGASKMPPRWIAKKIICSCGMKLMYLLCVDEIWMLELLSQALEQLVVFRN